jgi:perosamine synthetase
MNAADELPALLGGPIACPAGPPPWPGDRPGIASVLRRFAERGGWGEYRGSEVPALETELLQFFKVPNALTCATGTLAVEIALRAVGVAAGDEVVLGAYEYEANFATIHALGAVPVLVDCAKNLCLDPERLQAALSSKTRAVLASHLHGGLVPMAEVLAVANARGLAVVEDACQVPGAVLAGRPAGAWGHAAALSFGGSKLLSAGRGGAVLSADARTAQRMRMLLKRGPQEWAALSEMQAAVLRPQLEALANDTQSRFAAAVELSAGLSEIPGVVPLEFEPGAAFYKFAVRIDEAAFGLPRDLFCTALRAEGVAFDPGFRALHAGRSPSRFLAAGPLPNAEAAAANLAILHHPVLLLDVPGVVRAARKVYANSARIRAALPR